MEQENIKCSFIEHTEKKANIFCQECKIYMCHTCENFHSKLLQNHHTCNLDKNINDIYTGLCKEKNHLIPLKYFCKNHNQLCCAACISKIKDEENGQHEECDICPIEEIINEKKNILKDNIQCLENLSNNIEQKIQELKNIFTRINKDKEDLKIKVQKIFTKIRNEINEREDKISLEIDECFDNSFFKEDLIKQSENLPKKISINLEKGKLIGKENDNLALIVNDCINIENNIKEINFINENVEKNSEKNIEIKFSPEDNEMNDFLENIKIFGKIYQKQINKINEIFEPIKKNEELQPVIIRPAIHKVIQPIVQRVIPQPIVRTKVQPVIKEKIEPAIHPIIQREIANTKESVILKEIQPVIRKVPVTEIQTISQKKK